MVIYWLAMLIVVSYIYTDIYNVTCADAHIHTCINTHIYIYTHAHTHKVHTTFNASTNNHERNNGLKR